MRSLPIADTDHVAHESLARSARMHALRSLGLSWLALTAVLAGIFGLPHTLAAVLLPHLGLAAIPFAAVLALATILLLPLDVIGGWIVRELRAAYVDQGRLRNVAEEISIALGEPAGRVLVHESAIPNVGAFPTPEGEVVMATTGAVQQLLRAELEALIAAQFAGLRDPWCRLTTRAELAWTATIAIGFASALVSMPIGMFVAGAMVFMPRFVENTRDLCADVAAVAATRHPAALADAFRHLAPASADNSKQRLVGLWYLPVSPFLVLPKRIRSTTTVSANGKPSRTYTDAEEVAFELALRGDRAEALAAGADAREFTGREYRRRWSKLGTSGQQH